MKFNIDTMQQENINITWQQVSLIERFSSVLYPLDLVELLRILPTIGFVVPDISRAGVQDILNPIAHKGNIGLVVNRDNKTIGVKGLQIEEVIESYIELRSFYTERLDPSDGLHTQYIEFQGDGWAKSNNNPLNVFSSFWENGRQLKELANVINLPISNFGVQLVTPNKDPNDPEWFQFIIDPLIPSASKRYRIRCVWRGVDIKRLLKEFSRINNMLLRLINKLEE